ncbi:MULTISPECIES: HlyD family secretion protein [unclassified Caulobacter]|uniref:HlyD family secretion protein n=1 Tax=unclassified Caulobacter TaxID=2648921 RepID=UPI0006F9391F|nr:MULTISPECIES: HlyD family secretion protein [unclassified Caulobacter]KQV58403.1 transporter [Caulobacter sp. Root342]KQV69089.1 transporter [Caulobacter sp. Root343]
MTDATFEDASGVATKQTVKARKAPFSRKTVLAVGGALVVAAGGAALIAMPKGSVSTDAAYVQADSSSVAPKVRGLVAQVLVGHNQTVKRGDALVRIDPEEFDARVASAEADIANAEAAAASARAALISLDAEQRLAGSNIRAAQTAIAAADAENVRAQADRKRYEDLADSGAVARRDVERFRAAAVGAQSAADRSRAQLSVSQDEAAVTGAKRATLSANLAQAQAAVARARAALILARQDQNHTVIVSPIDGVVGDRQAEPGDYVQPGTRLMTIVPIKALYVTANFKETQVERMLPGQEATIKVDALGGKTLKGHVESFAPGSGSQFSLLPFEPGTGNFTKIVQRVPVRIRIDPGQAEVARLRPGLSTTVKVRLED